MTSIRRNADALRADAEQAEEAELTAIINSTCADIVIQTAGFVHKD